MAFSLAALGAGIGQFAQDYQRQQEQQRQTLMLQMQLADFQRKMDAETRDSQAAAIAFGPPGTAAQQPAKIQGLPQIGGGSQGWPSGGAAAGPNMVPGGAVAGRGNRLPFGQLYQLALDAGFEPGEKARTAAAVSMAESGGNPGAINWGDPGGSFGLMQVNAGAHGADVARSALDPATAFRESYRISRGGQDFSPWTVYKTGAYRRYLGEPILGGDAGTATDIAAGTGQFAMPTDAAAGLGAPRPTGPPDTLVAGGGAAPAGAFPANITMRGQGRDAVLVNADTGEPIQSAPGAPITVPPATPTDYSRPPPAVAPPPGAAAARPTSSLTGTGAVQPGGAQVAQAAPYTAPGMPQPPALPKSKEDLLREIYAQYPGVDGRVARKAAIDREKAEQENYKVQLQQHQANLEAWKLGPGHRREKIEDAAAQAERIAQIPSRQGQKDITLENGVTITGIPGDKKSWKTLTGEPLTPELWKMLSEGRIQVPGSYGANRKAEQIEVTNPDTGQRVFSGLAHETSQNKWVSAADGRVIDTANMKLDRQPISMGVTSQNIGNRISMGANEVARAVENMTAMPLGTTLGWFGGAQSIPARELADGLKRSLTNVITTESAQMLSAMGRGVERGLGILAAAGAATGLVALQESLKGEIPQENDTGFTVLTKYANMRQLVEAANDTIQASPMVADAQKKQMQANTDRIIKAVPWTVADVIKLRTKPTDQSVTDFAKKLGLGQQQEGEGAPAGAPAGAQAGPPPEAIADLQRDPSPTRRFQFDQIFGQGAADQAVGAPRARTPTPPPSGVFSAPIPPAQ